MTFARRSATTSAIGPAERTPLSEWTRLVDIRADGSTVHHARNLLARLAGIRAAAAGGWTPELCAQDARCEHQLRMILRGSRRGRPMAYSVGSLPVPG